MLYLDHTTTAGEVKYWRARRRQRVRAQLVAFIIVTIMVVTFALVLWAVAGGLDALTPQPVPPELLERRTP